MRSAPRGRPHPRGGPSRPPPPAGTRPGGPGRPAPAGRRHHLALHRPAVVRQRRLPRGVHHRPDDPAAAVHRVRPADGAHRRGQRRAGLPAAAAVPADVARAAEPRALPGRRRAVPHPRAAARRRRVRPVRRAVRGRPLADLAAVAQRHVLRPDRRPVRPGHLLLRLHLPVPALRAGLPADGDRLRAAGVRGHPLPVRRRPAADRWARRSAPPRGATCPCSSA
jgi:hypothetical protein